MSHTPVSQRLCQFVKSIQPASKEEVLCLLFNILEEGIVKVYYSYYVNFNKAVRKKQYKEQNLFKASQKSPCLIMMFKFVFG